MRQGYPHSDTDIEALMTGGVSAPYADHDSPANCVDKVRAASLDGYEWTEAHFCTVVVGLAESYGALEVAFLFLVVGSSAVAQPRFGVKK